MNMNLVEYSDLSVIQNIPGMHHFLNSMWWCT